VNERDLYEQHARVGQPLPGTIIDAHAHLGENPNFPIVASGPETLVATMDRIGVQLACVSGIPGCYGNATWGNKVIIEAVQRFPDRFFGYAMATVAYPEHIQTELETCWASGLRGTKIHSHAGPAYDHANYQRLFELTNERALPLLAHTWGRSDLDPLEPQIKRYPDIKFLLGHSGAADREIYVRLAKEYPNVYLELCFSACPRRLVEYFVSEGLAERMLWGSDASFMSMEQQVGRVVFAQISTEDKRRLLGDNAARVLGLTH
jgi:uncharacterized protein